jgi:hypothetical protein
MKIAYLILAHTHPLHLSRLVAALQTEHAHIFVHIDKKAEDMICPPLANNITVIQNTVSVNWGGFSVVQATLNLLQEAAAMGEYDYFILLSGADYPLRSNASIVQFFQHHQGEEFMSLWKMPELDKPFSRVEYFYIEDAHVFRDEHFKRKYPERYAHFTLYAGSQWWALSKRCIGYILHFILENPEYVDFYKYTSVPDEMFFHTIIGNSPFKKNVVNGVMYDDWETGSPAAITLQHLPILAQKTVPAVNGGKKTPLFARKFSDSSHEIITEIDTLFRNVEPAEAHPWWRV